MASLDSLPGDQRAVIQLVLQQRRRYDDIAALLSIDRAGVRQRALDAFDALGPSTSVPAGQRALLTDYLLGQLPGPVADEVHDRIASSPGERAWLRVVASEVAPLAADELPAIPGSGAERRSGSAPEPAAAVSAATAKKAPAAPRPPAASSPAIAAAPAGSGTPGSGGDSGAGSGARGTAVAGGSRRGGAIVLGLAAVIIAAVVVVLLVSSGGATKKLNPTASASTGTSSSSTTSTTSTSASKAKLVGQVNLNSPSNQSIKGIAQVIKEGSTLGVLIVATHVPANTTHNAYAVWLSNSSSDNEFVGFVSTRVGKDQKLETDGPLPSNAAHYKEMLVTLETHNTPKSPGPILLKGALKIT